VRSWRSTTEQRRTLSTLWSMQTGEPARGHGGRSRRERG